MKHFFTIALFMLGCLVFSQTSSDAANKLILEAAQKASVAESISHLSKNIPSLKTDADKKAAFSILGAMQEQAGKYEDAKQSYAAGAALAGATNSERLVIAAVRCALNAGDFESAQSFLASSVKNSKDAGIVALVKLYGQWAVLCKANNVGETEQAVATLKSFVDDKTMESVQPSVLLTLWHVTGSSAYSSKLKSQFPQSPEAKIVKGEVSMLPTPFWFFMPRTESALPDIAEIPAEKPPAAPEKPMASGEKVVREQLGLFRDVSNANALVQKAKEKGFDAKIVSETRPSGNVYYIVVVDEDEGRTVGKKLRTAGFECYPVFE